MTDFKVQLRFTLAGKSLDAPTRKAIRLIKDDNKEWLNENTLEQVRTKTQDHFGDRPIVIIDEEQLANDNIVYPNYFCAGWFVDSNGGSELVIIDHGSSLESARASMLSSVTSIDWETYSKKIPKI